VDARHGENTTRCQAVCVQETPRLRARLDKSAYAPFKVIAQKQQESQLAPAITKGVAL
jgi:hypothetical protein